MPHTGQCGSLAIGDLTTSNVRGLMLTDAPTVGGAGSDGTASQLLNVDHCAAMIPRATVTIACVSVSVPVRRPEIASSTPGREIPSPYAYTVGSRWPRLPNVPSFRS